MKKFNLLLSLVVALSASALTYVVMSARFDKYVEVTDNLLQECESICEEHDLYWGDTLCEGDTWSDFQEVRAELHLTQF